MNNHIAQPRYYFYFIAVLLIAILGGAAGIQSTAAAGPDPEPTPTVIPELGDLDLHSPDPIDGAWDWHSGTIQWSWINNCNFGTLEEGVGTYVSQWRDSTGGQPVPGQIYTLSVYVGALGNSCSGQYAYIDIQLPPNTTPAISESSPLVCWEGEIGVSSHRFYPPDCPSELIESVWYPAYSNVYQIEAPSGLWVLPEDIFLEFLIPVVTTTTLTGDNFIASVRMSDGHSNPELTPYVGINVYEAELPAPGAFSKTSPSHNSTKPTSVPLYWGTSSDATSYEYCIDTNNDQSCNTSWISTGTSTSAALSGLSPGATYYWQVRAKNSSGTTYANSGGWWRFYTAAASGSPARNDFDGDEESDPAKFYPGTGTAWWLKSTTSSWDSAWLGSGSFDYVPYSDFDGDGMTDPGKFTSADGTVWYIKSSNSAWEGTYLGTDSYTYVAGNDFDGDGKTDPTKLLPNGAIWYPQSSSGVWEGFWVGPEDFEYVAGSDFDGDGMSDPAKFIDDPGVLWYWKSSTSGWVGVFLGSDAYSYVPASDFDGDGETDPAKFYPSTDTVWWLKSSTGTWDAAYMGTGSYTFVGGNDFDGDGETDPAKFVSSSGTLFWLKSSTGTWDSAYIGSDSYELVN